MRVLGLLLIAAGLAVLLVGGVSRVRQREVAHVGKVRVSVSEQEPAPLAPRLGGAALMLAGAGLVVAGQQRRRRRA